MTCSRLIDRIQTQRASNTHHIWRLTSLSHAHLTIQHLLKQVELYSARCGKKRTSRPEWAEELIDQVAELFEPLSDVGRVGFDFQPSDERDEIGFYLGCTEIVGGKDDGERRHINFQFDALRMQALFGRVDRFVWNAFPDNDDPEAAPVASHFSFLTLDADYHGHAVRLHIYGMAPESAGPGLRQWSDGTVEPV